MTQEEDEDTESELEEFNEVRAEENHAEENHADVANSVSPVHQVDPIHPADPVEVEVESVNKTKTNYTQAKEPKVTKAKEPKVTKVTKAKEPKAKEPKAKEPKAKEPKAKEPKAKEPNVTKATKSIAEVVPTTPAAPVVQTTSVSISVTAANSATSATPLREDKASSDGNFYLMSNYPRESFTYNGKTYLRTETDNVYDTMTLEMIGVWDHLNHEIITAFDDDEVDELWLSDEE